MLEWLKTILGDHYTEDIDKQISAEIGKGFVARADFNSKNDELKTANDTIKGLKEAAKKFDGQDVEGLKTQLSTLQTKYDTDIAAVRKASAIDIALANSRAKNGKAARALLDLDAVKLDGNKLLGFDDQLEALKKSDPWLFEADTTKQDDGTGVHVDTGAEHGQGGSTEPSDGVTAAFAALNPDLKL